jgi:hypothetical protein
MSALLPKADMCAATGDVCYGPKADVDSSPALIEHPVRTCEYRRWHANTDVR